MTKCPSCGYKLNKAHKAKHERWAEQHRRAARAYQARKRVAKRCQICGSKPLVSTLLCATCLLANRIRARRREGCNSWVITGMGRPPIPLMEKDQ